MLSVMNIRLFVAVETDLVRGYDILQMFNGP